MLSRLNIQRRGIVAMRKFTAKVQMDEAVKTQIENNDMKPKKHPGIMKTQVSDLPDWVTESTVTALGDMPKKTICDESKKFRFFISARRLPPDMDEVQAKYNKIQKSILKKQNIRFDGMEEEDLQSLCRKNHGKAMFNLKRTTYNWTSIEYDRYKCLLYLVGCANADYAVLIKIFNEISKRDSEFNPTTLFDFGSGVGTVIWAAHQTWGKSIREYFCVESSFDMNELSAELLKKATPPIKNIFYRQFFPASPNPQYDIVVSAYSLLELPSAHSRLQTLLKLWRKTNNYLIIVEQGTRSGFKIVNEARDFILQLQKSNLEKYPKPAYVFAPCPHDLMCPRYAMDDNPCNFEASYFTSPLIGSKQLQRTRYSYVVLRKGERPEDEEKWPRMDRTVLVRARHTICRMCTPSGKLQQVIFTKSKHGKSLYHLARATKWGDRLPIDIDETQLESDKEVERNIKEEEEEEEGEEEEVEEGEEEVEEGEEEETPPEENTRP